MRLLLSIFFCCSYLYAKAQSIHIMEEELIDSPMPFDMNTKNFMSAKNPSYKLKKFVFVNYPGDTIYRFQYKKSRFFFSHSTSGEYFMQAQIFNKKIVCNAGIRIGMRKEDFIIRIDGYSSVGDTLHISRPGKNNNITFIFKKNRLYNIKIGTGRKKHTFNGLINNILFVHVKSPNTWCRTDILLLTKVHVN